MTCGPSVGANYREANRVESHDDFIHKFGIVEKEASETCYWLELCEEAGIGVYGTPMVAERVERVVGNLYSDRKDRQGSVSQAELMIVDCGRSIGSISRAFLNFIHSVL